MAVSVRSVFVDWWGSPDPSFEIRQPSARWERGARRAARRAVRVAEVVRETPTTATFVLAPAPGDTAPLAYEAGQHLTVLVDVGGVSYRRCYSFSSAPAAGGRPAITVKRIPEGVVSGFLHDHVRAGDTLAIMPASGSFTLPADGAAARRYVLVAGGVGITPLISLAETVLRLAPASTVVLVAGNRTEDEIIFRARLEALRAEFPQRLHLHLALDAPPAGWTGVAGRLDGARVLEILGTTDADLFYLCGPEPMMASVTAALSGAGVPSECIRTERFAYATLETGALPVQAHDVLFAASGSRVRVQPGHTILEAALAAGVPLPSSCTMGGCGACKLHMREGSVVMRQPNCLSAREREEGYVLTCCAYPSRDVVIEGG